MPRGRKKKRSRRRKSFSILNALESLTYASIISQGTTGGGIFEFFTGKKDIGISSGATGMTAVDPWDRFGYGLTSGMSENLTGADQVSLKDLMSQPSLSLGVMTNNFANNIIPMAAGAFVTSMTFRIGKRLLRAPINNVNRNIVKPALGAGIKL